ncbi:hypothetical protein ILUMI_08155 [Ignelater luminosus]|uniref:BRCT domain-containing protein n=1 Tax=Ignelater luminosus TaxID=2038154 RepID=A0A8K0D2G4_IGNLU|nr:hypothetical protein ILUMI_08155 [Ignelater luminosus]
MKVQTRKSIAHFASTPLSLSERKNANQKSRRSTSSLGSEGSDKSPMNILFEMVMSDPKKKALVKKLLHEDRDKIEEYKKQETRKNLAKNKRIKKLQRMLHCESPTALLRRRALERDNLSNTDNSSTISSHSFVSSQKKPFEKLLTGIVAYIEINSQGKDCSAGAKTLMQAMGATVKDQFGPEITHVIFKDGSYNTFKTAKLLKMHVVSVLWLEAVRKSNVRVPEKNYPALGAEYDNISQICQDYESVINEEYRRSLAISSQNDKTKSRKTALPSELEPLIESDLADMPNTADTNISSNRRLTEIIPSSQAWEAESIISCESGTLPYRRIATTSNEDDNSISGSLRSYLTSDTDSDCGMIDGHSVRKSSDLSQLDMSLNMLEDCQNKVVDESDKKGQSANTSANTSSSRSVSLLSKKSRKSNCYETVMSAVDMELTANLDYVSNKENYPNSNQKERLKAANKDNLKTPLKPNSNLVEETIRITIHDGLSGDDKLHRKSYVNLSKTFSNESTPSLRISNENQNKQKDSSLESSVPRRSTRRNYLTELKEIGNDSITCSNKRNSSSGSTGRRSTRSSNRLQISDGSQKRSSQFTEDRFSLRISSDVSNDPVEKNKTSNGGKNSVNSENDFSLRISSENSRTSADSKKKRSSSKTSLNSFSDTNKKRRTSTRNSKSQGLTDDERFSLRISSEHASEIVDEVNSTIPLPDNVVEECPEISKETESQLHDDNENTSTRKNDNNNSHNLSKNLSLRKSKDDSCIPNKKQKVDQNLTKSERKPRRFRKLYNLNQSYDEEAFRNWNLNNVEVQSQPRATEVAVAKVHDITKKTVVIPLTPIKITPAVKKLYDKTKSKSKTKKKQNSKKKHKETSKVSKKVQLDNSKDEQKELIDEYVNKKKDKHNESKEEQPFKKPTNRRLFSPKKLNDSVSNKIISTTRRSTLDFVEITQRKRRRLVHKIRNPTIVCTRLHREEVENFTQIVKKLGYFLVEDEVTPKTTHLVVGESKRTINLLRAIARGCWIVTKEWLFRSLEASKWLAEDDFELSDFSPAVQQCRMQRQAFGPLFSMDIFVNCGPIYVGHNSLPRRSDLQELIELCKGVITNVAYNANIVVGDWVRYEGVTCVTEKWVLDSITFNKCKSLKNYIIRQPS